MPHSLRIPYENKILLSIYLDRITHRDCDHRHSGKHRPAGIHWRATTGETNQGPFQREQIAIALRQFALDNNGDFPNKEYAFGKSYTDSTLTPISSGSTSNSAFRWLIPTYTQSEEIFAVPGSKWNFPGPDNKIDATAGGDTLKVGENGYAYTAALQDTSNTLFPLVQDGWSTTIPKYVADTSLPGGVWTATKAIVIFPDGAGQVMTVDDRTNLTVLRPGGYSYSIWDLSKSASPDDWLATTNFLLNPE